MANYKELFAEATDEQRRFIERLRAVMLAHTPPLALPYQLEVEALQNWRDPGPELVAYAAGIGPTLAAKFWRQMQEPSE